MYYVAAAKGACKLQRAECMNVTNQSELLSILVHQAPQHRHMVTTNHHGVEVTTISPQAIRAPALPVVLLSLCPPLPRSSGSACTMNDRPCTQHTDTSECTDPGVDSVSA